MARTSPLTVTYKDLLDLAQELLMDRQARYAGAKGRGTSNLDVLTHQVEVARTLVRMLRKGLPVKQTDFMDLFQQVKKRQI